MFHRLLAHTWDKIPSQDDRDYVDRIASEILVPSPSQSVPWPEWDGERAVRETRRGFEDGGRDPLGIPYAGRRTYQKPLDLELWQRTKALGEDFLHLSGYEEEVWPS